MKFHCRGDAVAQEKQLKIKLHAELRKAEDAILLMEGASFRRALLSSSIISLTLCGDEPIILSRGIRYPF
jgi:hypothetical protein